MKCDRISGIFNKYEPNEPKQTELAKHKHGVNTMQTNISVTFDMTVATA